MRSLSASAASLATATQSARELQRRVGSLPSKGGTAVLQGVGVQAGTGLNAVQQGAGVLGGVHVLVVDNAAVNLLVARRTLTRSGATVATTASGEEALRLVKLALEGTVHPMEPALGGSAQPADGHVDVVLMDLQMPLMDGFATTEAIRAHEQALLLHLASPPEAAAGAATGDTQPDMQADVDDGVIRRCLASGFDGVLQKPVDPKLLSQLLLRLELGGCAHRA
ncbi:unnamed protein product [Closterium sp. NIES-65]|nr:unnamed protein product [Closterium sp. NIES-65]